MRPLRSLAIAIVFATVALGCSADDEEPLEAPPVFTPATGDGEIADPGTTLLPPTPPDPPEIEGPSLVDFAVPCGLDAQPTLARGPGIDGTTIRIATGNDEGGRFAGRSGATMPEAVVAMAEHCNTLGGLAGRAIAVDSYDAVVNELPDVAAVQCAEAFALVGFGYLEPLGGLEAWDGCAVPRFDGWAADIVRPEPVALFGHQLAAFADPAALNVAVVAPDTFEGRAVAEQAQAALTAGGFVVVATEFFSLTTEPDWAGIAARVASAGAGLIHLDGPCRAATVPLLAVTGAEGPAVVTGPSSYDRSCVADAQADGVSLDPLLIHLPFLPVEDGADAPTTAAFAEIFETYGADATGDALLAAAAFWEFVVAVDGCRDSELTRTCVDRRRPAAWDGAGLFAGAEAVACRVVVRVNRAGFARVLPEEPGRFGCPDA